MTSKTKPIAAYNASANPTDGWYTIASPVEEYLTPPSSMLTDTYDLYYYNESNNLWKNYKNVPFDFYNGKGYLYANSNDMTLAFTGDMIPTNEAVVLYPFYTDAAGDLKGYNLMGNPFTRNLTNGEITLDGAPLTTYYMVEGGSELLAYDLNLQPIKPGQGFFVQATAAGQELVLGAQPSGSKRGATQGILCIEAGNDKVMDRAFVQIGGGNTLRKMNLNEQSTKLYVMNEGKDWAAATLEAAEGEVPVCFKAAKNGTYTMSVSTQGLDLEYLHLIDNMTDADVDLLVSPSYSFSATTSDYASRFRLVFSADEDGPSTGSGTFAYVNNGNIIITADVNDATLQIIDVMGRIIVSGDAMNRVSTGGMAPGVYVLRLVYGDDVRTQKMVIQ